MLFKDVELNSYFKFENVFANICTRSCEKSSIYIRVSENECMCYYCHKFYDTDLHNIVHLIKSTLI
jgi:hypothetical protein